MISWKGLVILIILTCTFMVWLTFYVNWNIGISTIWSIQQPAKTRSRYCNTTGRNWVVMYSNSSSSKSMEAIQSIPGWKIVIVGDKDWFNETRCLDCCYLSPTMQRELGYKIHDVLPKTGYSRKMIGYLFAIAHNAEVIFDTLHDIRLFQKLNTSYMESLVDKSSMNDTVMGILPYEYCYFSSGSIHHNHATNRSIAKSILNDTQNIEQITTDLNGPASNKTIMSALISIQPSNTVFLYDALWALVLPATLTYPTCDILRRVWGGRLLLELGKGVFKLDINHHHTCQYNDTLQIKSQIQSLKSWRCPMASGLYMCMLLLSSEMVKLKLWQDADTEVIKSWIEDLQNVGYRHPVRVHHSVPNKKKLEAGVILHYPELSTSGDAYLIREREKQQIVEMTSLCHNSNFTTLATGASKTYSETLLIIVFNHPFYENIPYLELIYGVTFPKIVYCGIKKYSNLTTAVTFIDIEVNDGEFYHRCWSAALKLNYDVSGYLMIGDDTLLNSWNLRSLPLDKAWFWKLHPVFRDKSDKWSWWSGELGQTAFNDAWIELIELESTSVDEVQSTIQKFIKTLAKNSGSPQGLFRGTADIVYVPQRMKEDIIYFVDLFNDYDVFVEIVIPTVLTGLSKKSEIMYLNGDYLWEDDRDYVSKFFNETNVFLHPVKLSEIKTSLNTFFCETYFPLILKGQ